MFETTVRKKVLRIHREETNWLSTGLNGGLSRGNTAYSLTVPDDWKCCDPNEYVETRLRDVGFDQTGPSLLTAVDLDHMRGARSGPVEVFVTAGISNPAELPMDPPLSAVDGSIHDGDQLVGTVNMIIGTTRSLDTAALTNLLSVAVEAKTATLLEETGFPGTTSDAVIIGCDPTGEPATYTGSATPIGAAARACVRDAIQASLKSRYPDQDFPTSISAAEYGISTDRRAAVFRVCDSTTSDR